jgi:uncharacterized protein (DUF2384 family)
MTPITDPATESTADDRARLVVRMALRAFGDGTQTAEWLSQPSRLFDGHSPLFTATTSSTGCARVCRLLDGLVGD